jgi:hypothetical protein
MKALFSRGRGRRKRRVSMVGFRGRCGAAL